MYIQASAINVANNKRTTRPDALEWKDAAASEESGTLHLPIASKRRRRWCSFLWKLQVLPLIADKQTATQELLRNHRRTQNKAMPLPGQKERTAAMQFAFSNGPHLAN
jgi:hypothetical protein